MLVGLLAAAGCVRAPRALAPVRWSGVVRAGHLGLEGRAAPDASAPAGVLRLQEALLECPITAAACRWTASLENPWRARFEVTLSLIVRDAGDAVVASATRSVVIGPGRRRLEGTLPPLESARARSFSIEYWVRPVPPPTRAPVSRR